MDCEFSVIVTDCALAQLDEIYNYIEPTVDSPLWAFCFPNLFVVSQMTFRIFT